MRALEQKDLGTSRTTEGLPAVYRKQGRDDEAEKLDGKLGASASEDGTVRLWDSATGPVMKATTGKRGNNTAILSPRPIFAGRPVSGPAREKC